MTESLISLIRTSIEDHDISSAKTAIQRLGTHLNFSFHSIAYSLLGYACVHSTDITAFLLTRPGLDINWQDKFGETAFLDCCRREKLESARLLLARPDLDANAKNRNDIAPFYTLVHHGYMSIIVAWMASGHPMPDMGDPKDLMTEPTIHGMIQYAKMKDSESIHDLLSFYRDDPTSCRHAARLVEGHKDKLAAHLFAMVIFLCEGFSELGPDPPEKISRFASILTKLPMEIQMIVCCRTVGLMDDFIPVGVTRVALRFMNNGLSTTDSIALASLQGLTTGLHWDFGSELCGQTGITCTSGNANVLQLNLPSTFSAGAIPTLLGTLYFMQVLNLGGVPGTTGLTGTIPFQIGTLAALQSLTMQDHTLDATVGLPTQIGNITALTSISMVNCFQGPTTTYAVPTQLGSLTNLVNLTLASPAAAGALPTQLGALTHLLTVNITRPPSITPFIGNATTLKTLALPGRFSGSVPTALGKLTNLVYLDVGCGGCDIYTSTRYVSTMPTELGLCTKLTTLILNNIVYGSTIPTAWQSLTAMQYLDVSGAATFGTTPYLFMGNLNHLDVSFNNPGTNANTMFLGMTRLTYLNMAGLNNITTGAPTQIGGLPLTYLNISGSGYVSIPTQWTNLTRLQTLDIHRGMQAPNAPILDLTPILPMTSLQYLDVSFCQSSTALASFLPATAKMAYLDLSGNPIPTVTTSLLTFLSAYTNLTYLALSSSQIAGTLPTQYLNSASLLTFNISNNAIYPTIPTQICTTGTKLKILDMRTNSILFPVPTQLASCTALTTVYLGSNNIDGTVPTLFTTLTNLRTLDLSYNQLTPPLPTALGTFTTLTSLNLAGNKFSGSIPGTVLAGMTGLTTLNMSYNDLSGTFPTNIFTMTSLQNLDISHNMLYSTLPTLVGQLTSLTSLNISYNFLTGTIPTQANIPGMAYLFLSGAGGNNFCPVANYATWATIATDYSSVEQPCFTCAPFTCLNGGTCSNNGSPTNSTNFTCTCASGFSGQLCQTPVCVTNFCLNGGTCVPAAPGSGDVDTCLCMPFYEGYNCSDFMNSCASNPCGPNSTCVNSANCYTCLYNTGQFYSNCTGGIPPVIVTTTTTITDTVTATSTTTIPVTTTSTATTTATVNTTATYNVTSTTTATTTATQNVTSTFNTTTTTTTTTTATTNVTATFNTTTTTTSTVDVTDTVTTTATVNTTLTDTITTTATTTSTIDVTSTFNVTDTVTSTSTDTVTETDTTTSTAITTSTDVVTATETATVTKQKRCCTTSPPQPSRRRREQL